MREAWTGARSQAANATVAKAATRCPFRKVYGITYGLADGLCGGWAEAIHLKAGTLCIPMDGTEPERFMAGGCSLPTALHAVERACIAPGDTVLVLGSGPVGLSSIAVALMQGAVPAPEPVPIHLQSPSAPSGGEVQPPRRPEPLPRMRPEPA